jgi:hypothetical protein
MVLHQNSSMELMMWATGGPASYLRSVIGPSVMFVRNFRLTQKGKPLKQSGVSPPSLPVAKLVTSTVDQTDVPHEIPHRGAAGHNVGNWFACTRPHKGTCSRFLGEQPKAAQPRIIVSR